jgi:hypothetical protein
VTQMNQILKSCLYYGAGRVGELPFFRARFAARAAIILFHEIQAGLSVGIDDWNISFAF